MSSRARIALLAALAPAAVAGCSLILDFAPASDGGPGDDGGGDDGGGAVNCDVGEPNDTVEEARAVDDEIAAAVCGDGPDYWSFEVDGAQDVTISLTFSASTANDLELQLLSMTEEILTISTGTDGDEQIEQSSALGNQLEAGTYVIAVIGREAAAMNDYQLAVDISTPTPDAGP